MVKRTNKRYKRVKRMKRSRKSMRGGSDPSLVNNFKKAISIAAQAGDNLVSSGLNKVADVVGVNPNEGIENIVHEEANKVKQFADVLKSPEGEELISEAKEIGEQAFDGVVKPVIDKVAEESTDFITKELDIGAKGVNAALGEFPPYFALEELADVGAAAGTAIESGLNVIPAITGAVGEANEVKNKGINFVDRVKGMFSGFNTSVASHLDAIKSKVDEQGEKINENQITNPISSSLQGNSISRGGGGGNLSKLIKQAKMIGGRTQKARADFLNPHLTLSQLVQPHRSKTQRRSSGRR